ncbi:tRNA pseudouridine(55) synthase TruB [Agromyces salentinus]|uniref:tRNA pseudouridine synthase B n=1 Tax=Agromyces salentinus TaxID=269421 RepID=A0ABN2MWT3_9MICO
MNSGILLVDKPQGLTSHDVVARTRRLAGTRKIGHAGTLDPMATGLLVLGVNSATRLLTYLVGLDKEYVATIRLGAATTTDDAEGELLGAASADLLDAVDDERIAAGVLKLTGEIQQVPSTVSAIKVDGKRAYQRVRDGEQVELKSRAVTISAFEVVDLRRAPTGGEDGDGFIDLDVRVECSSGTYIRALARDLGVDLGVGGHLTALRRTRIGRFSVAEAATLEDLDVASALIGAADAAGRAMPVVHLTAQQAVDLGHGKRIDAEAAPATGPGDPIAAVAPDGRLVAIVERRRDGLKVVAGFPADEAAS